jgi:hypothetical protein
LPEGSLKGREECAMLLKEVSRDDQDKRRDSEMKMRIIVTIENEDESDRRLSMSMAFPIQKVPLIL